MIKTKKKKWVRDYVLVIPTKVKTDDYYFNDVCKVLLQFYIKINTTHLCIQVFFDGLVKRLTNMVNVRWFSHTLKTKTVWGRL